MAQHTLFKDNDNIIIARGLSTVNELGQTVFLDDTADVEITLRVAGALVPGATWPQTLLYISESDGDFYANLADTLTLPTSGVVDALIVVDAGDDQHGEINASIVIQTRRF